MFLSSNQRVSLKQAIDYGSQQLIKGNLKHNLFIIKVLTTICPEPDLASYFNTNSTGNDNKFSIGVSQHNKSTHTQIMLYITFSTLHTKR